MDNMIMKWGELTPKQKEIINDHTETIEGSFIKMVAYAIKDMQDHGKKNPTHSDIKRWTRTVQFYISNPEKKGGK